ncbi:predicted protein [Streptomyces albidoflavus]|nr:predicted protein [Streptomyces albidoflavus]
MPGYLLTNCRVRGQSLQDGRVCSLLRGHPDPSPPHGLVRGQPPEGGIRPSPIQGLSTVTTVIALARHKDQWVTALSSSHRRDDADETEGRGRAGVPPQQTAR